MKTSAYALLILLSLAMLVACRTGKQPASQPTQGIPAIPIPQTEATPPARQPASAPLSLSAMTGKIAYAHEGNIYVMNANGTEVNRLTTDPAMDFDPAWPPDGGRIAFHYTQGRVLSSGTGDFEYASSTTGTDSGQFPDWHQPTN